MNASGRWTSAWESGKGRGQVESHTLRAECARESAHALLDLIDQWRALVAAKVGAERTLVIAQRPARSVSAHREQRHRAVQEQPQRPWQRGARRNAHFRHERALPALGGDPHVPADGGRRRGAAAVGRTRARSRTLRACTRPSTRETRSGPGSPVVRWAARLLRVFPPRRVQRLLARVLPCAHARPGEVGHHGKSGNRIGPPPRQQGVQSEPHQNGE